MTSEHKDWIKGEQSGRSKGVRIFIPWDVLGPVIHNKKKIPDDTPIEELRFKRYPTKNNIIIDVRRIPKMMTQCNKCGSKETTPASKGSRCFFCKEGTMEEIS